METSPFQQIFNQQKAYFISQATKSYLQRVEVLKKLRAQILKYESRIIQAMQADMAKPETEATGGEIWYVLEEIGYTSRQLKSWMKLQRKRTPLLHFIGTSRIYPEPYGQVLIMAPWNYPFHLLFSPLVGALAAGNTAILKPSDLAPNTAEVIEEMVNDHFDPILPILPYENLEDALEMIQMNPNPLALYLFTRDRSVEKRVIAELPFGGGCINDTFSHVFNEEIPFGRRGMSGMGAYHGNELRYIHTFQEHHSPEELAGYSLALPAL